MLSQQKQKYTKVAGGRRKNRLKFSGISEFTFRFYIEADSSRSWSLGCQCTEMTMMSEWILMTTGGGLKSRQRNKMISFKGSYDSSPPFSHQIFFFVSALSVMENGRRGLDADRCWFKREERKRGRFKSGCFLRSSIINCHSTTRL